MTGIMVTLQPLLLLGKPFCFGYLHGTKQHDPKLAELCGKENIVQILQNIKPCQVFSVATHTEKIPYQKECLQPNFQTLENTDLQQARVTLKCIKGVSIKHRLCCHHSTCM